MNNELLKQETVEEILQAQLDRIGKGNTTQIQFCYQAIFVAMEEYASLRSKELQERVERLASCLSRVLYWDNGDLPENAIRDIKSALSGEAQSKDESLEAYNRECKRVDELTEEVAMLQSRLKSEYERGYNQGIVEAAKEL